MDIRPAGGGVVADYRRTALSEFLQGRRARFSPDPRSPAHNALTERRVPGLRREEVAWAASISPDYYTKLEQGRVLRPSPEVRDSVADALLLSDVDRLYFRALTTDVRRPLTRDSPVVATAGAQLSAIAGLIPSAVMLHLLHQDLTLAPIGARTREVMQIEDAQPAGPYSLLEYVFRNPAAPRVYVDWWEKAHEVVGIAHLSLARHEASSTLTRVVDQLWDSSASFRRIWKKYEPAEKANGSWRLHVDGHVREVAFHTVQVPECADVSLVIYSG